MLNKKDRLKTSKLSSTVLDYYYKYGQNRDLEKYLRLKRQSTSKSSSDSSLRNYGGSDSLSDSRRITKSMEKLDLSGRKPQIEDDSEFQTKHSAENVDKSNRDKSKDKPKSSETKQIKIEKKTQQQWAGKSKSKSYNFNLESSIEIALPTSTVSMPTIPTIQTIDCISKPTQTLQWESSETQTEPFQGFQPGPSTSVEQTPPTVSAVERKSDRMKPTAENAQDISPASSVASAKVRLEWDSMADVGYNRIIDFKSQSNSNLTTFERSALTKFFAKRGLNFDENLVILAPADKKSPLQKREFTQSAIEMRDAQKIRRELPSLSPSTNKHLWEKALMKYREKYGGHSREDGSSCIDATQFNAPHHSTPLPNELSQSSQYGEKHVDHSNDRPIKSIPDKPTTQRLEKWSQTSSIDVEAIGIQVEQPQIQRISKSSQIQIEQVHESTQKDDEDLTTATSFEYLAPSLYQNQQAIDRMQVLPPPIIPPMPSSAMAEDIPKRADTPHNIYTQEENVDEKENIPPVEDKENIPPPTLHTMPRNDQPSVFKTPENTILEKTTEQSMLPNDLQKGVDLINALIDSRTTDSTMKKKLIRKIVRHLLKSRDTKDITQMIMSYSEKTNSKMSGVSSLTEHEASDQSKNDKLGKDTISGVSTLSSSSSNASAAIEPNHSNEAIESPQNTEQNRKQHADETEKKDEIDVENDENKHIKKKERKEELEDQLKNGVREWLLPATQSEIDKENARKLQSLQTVCAQETQSKVLQTNVKTNSNKHLMHRKSDDKSPKNDEIIEFLEHEKKTHSNWIDQEIQHLKNLKLLLNKLNPSDSDASNRDDISDEKINSVYAKHNREYLAIYENFRRTRKHTSGNGSQADVSSTLIDTTRSSGDSSRSLNCGKFGSKSHWIHKTTLESPPSTISSGSKLSKQSEQQPKIKMSNKLPEWDSHLNMQQLVKNRTKLKTPNSDESIDAHAKACRAKFERKSAKTTKSDHSKKERNKKSARQPPIYTKPYSSDSYSYLPNMQRSNEDRLKEKQSDIVDAYTSETGSGGFLSPNSISIGVAANSTSNTTTHQYDTKISVGLQTTNTLERMPIIQMKKSIEIPPDPISQDQPPTVRVNKLTINKQLQVRPESLAYIIIFKEDDDADENANSKGQERGNQLYGNANRINSTAASNSNNSSSRTGSDDVNTKAKSLDIKEQATQFQDRTNSSTSSGTSVENLTLQEYLQARRPDFYANAEHRRKCLIDLHNLRQQRNEQRKKLLAMNMCSNAKILNRNMKRLLPPPPLAQMRIFNTKEIVNQTRRKYQRLPEIRQRQQMERDMKIRRNHRILVNVFSKNLQKHVLSGKTDLSNSMMIN